MQNKILKLTYMSMALALLIVCSKISFSIGPIPLTLQTLSVIIISYLLKWKSAFVVFLVYIIMGLLGIPVFSEGGGFAYVLKPSFGFIIGFMLSSLVVGTNFSNKKIYTYIKGLLGLFLIDFVGIVYMALILNGYYGYNKSFSYIISIGFTPFIIKDIVSVFLAALVYSRINVAIKIDIAPSIKKREN